MKKHDCHQVDEFNNIKKQIAGVKVDLDQHREAQQENEKERLVYREKREKHDLRLNNDIENIKLALFGNEELGIIGDHTMIKEMHMLLIQGSAIKKFLAWTFGAIMAVIAAVALIVRLIKDAK